MTTYKIQIPLIEDAELILVNVHITSMPTDNISMLKCHLWSNHPYFPILFNINQFYIKVQQVPNTEIIKVIYSIGNKHEPLSQQLLDFMQEVFENTNIVLDGYEAVEHIFENRCLTIEELSVELRWQAIFKAIEEE